MKRLNIINWAPIRWAKFANGWECGAVEVTDKEYLIRLSNGFRNATVALKRDGRPSGLLNGETGWGTCFLSSTHTLYGVVSAETLKTPDGLMAHINLWL